MILLTTELALGLLMVLVLATGLVRGAAGRRQMPYW